MMAQAVNIQQQVVRAPAVIAYGKTDTIIGKARGKVAARPMAPPAPFLALGGGGPAPLPILDGLSLAVGSAESSSSSMPASPPSEAPCALGPDLLSNLHAAEVADDVADTQIASQSQLTGLQFMGNQD